MNLLPSGIRYSLKYTVSNKILCTYIKLFQLKKNKLSLLPITIYLI